MSSQNGSGSGEKFGGCVFAKTSQGVEVNATLERITRNIATFEVCDAACTIRSSEVLCDLNITMSNRTVYSGNGVVRSLVNKGAMTLCEVALNEESWREVEFSAEMLGNDRMVREFHGFVLEWQKSYRVLPEYKVVVADMQSFLHQLRLWVEQIELGVRSSPSGDRLSLEKHLADQLSTATFPFLDTLFDKLDAMLGKMDFDLRAIHSAYAKRQVHPYILSSPFVFRSVYKPMGYAGDYEIVNMILRDPHEGGSLYGKILNRWFIKQPPAEAHRNRISYLTQRLLEETVRLSSQGKRARVFNLGCGPAKEIQDFMAQYAVSDQTNFTLLDFSEETLAHAKKVIGEVHQRYARRATLNFVKRSVANVLKGRDRTADGAGENKYDFVYCAGLFDYLTDPVCKQLMNIFYDMLAPGGLLVATNVDASNPIQNWLGDILDWYLIYRDHDQMAALRPDRADPELARVVADITGVNIFLEVRKSK